MDELVLSYLHPNTTIVSMEHMLVGHPWFVKSSLFAGSDPHNLGCIRSLHPLLGDVVGVSRRPLGSKGAQGQGQRS